MSNDRFALCLAETLKWEGGWSNHPADPGGATNRGVIQRVYNAWRTKQGLPIRSVREIEESEIQAIYRQNYWNLVRGDEQPAGIDLAVFDFCVNAGPSQAIKSLQRVLGVTRDGHLGAATMAAIATADPGDLVTKYTDERERFYRVLPTFPVFGKGWVRRADGVEHACLAMLGEQRTVPPPMPLPDADSQSATQARASAPDPKPPVATEASLFAGGAGGVAGGIAGGFKSLAAAASKGAVTSSTILYAFLSEPLIWVGLLALFGSVMTFMWRRAHA
jgi:lysozyme family protein